MQEKIRNIRLYGRLGAKFGRVHRIAVNSTREAIRALCVLVPGFEKELVQSQDKGIGYACFVGKQNLKEDELLRPIGNDDIRIAPIVMGSKRGGLFQIFAGIALVIASVYTGGAAAGIAAGAAAGASAGAAGATAAGAMGAMAGSMLAGGGAFALGSMGMLGVSLALGGVSQLLSPQPKGLSAKDGPGNSPSYNFNGPVNVTAEGNPVGILYGHMRMGGATVSAGIFPEDKL